MVVAIWHLVPNVETLLALQPEDLAGVVLEALNSRPDERFHPGNFVSELFYPPQNPNYPLQHQRAIQLAMWSAWNWLVREGLLVQEFGSSNYSSYEITRRGRELKGKADFAAYRTATRLPRDLLHPKLRDDPWLSFVRGKYGMAIFEAFREVEVAVRDAGGFDPSDIGTPLMRKAFDPKKGPLTQMTDEDGEREGLAHLFAGAIASYKNPHSHRKPGLDDPLDAIEMLMLASHLLRIIDARRPRKPGR